MNIEVLIYMYALICLALIGFDGMWLVIKYVKTKKITKSEADYYQIIEKLSTNPNFFPILQYKIIRI